MPRPTRRTTTWSGSTKAGRIGAVVNRFWSFIVTVLVVLGLFGPSTSWARTAGDVETRVRGIDLFVPVVVGVVTASSPDLHRGIDVFAYEDAVGATLAAGEANIVYRGLAAGEESAAGLLARAPEAGNSIASHVAGARASQWISTTRSLDIAMSRFGQN